MLRFKFFILSWGFITVQSTFLQAQNYQLKSPKAIFHLPSILREVSGISVTNHKEVICVQDELGIIFRYDTEVKDVVDRDSFYVKGDFEGIASVGEEIYVLRSDGAIIEVKYPFTNQLITQTYYTTIPAVDSEGMCYDKENNRLLIACKSECFGEGASLDKRMIYAFDLNEKKLIKDPVLVMDIPTIRNFLVTKYKISSWANIHFNPSELAIHPVTGKLYVLSADAKLLCVFNKGEFESAEMLDEALFYKAEGLAFFDNGDMLISNEGPRKGLATVLLFKFKK